MKMSQIFIIHKQSVIFLKLIHQGKKHQETDVYNIVQQYYFIDCCTHILYLDKNKLKRQ